MVVEHYAQVHWIITLLPVVSSILAGKADTVLNFAGIANPVAGQVRLVASVAADAVTEIRGGFPAMGTGGGSLPVLDNVWYVQLDTRHHDESCRGRKCFFVVILDFVGCGW
jgi:hypothetical protein